ncbi:MAG: hypothetical protein M1825_001771 [Sarcosagium campestre]|nr:MAG: hypothetical protein M1825_001771 [Sarcosagium campestre]
MAPTKGGAPLSPPTVGAPGSGRASPVGRLARTRTDDDLHKEDKAYRRYASGLERALSLFDTTLQEWADYISFLGRLLKALQAHPSTIKAVPFKAVVAKRLAQCLNPSLPSGVHQKTLEVYAFVFEMIGSDALSRDILLYLPGLSSTLSFAALSVRPSFLSLLETYILKIHPTDLRPALKAIILALLPGLEDESSEDFERTLRLIESFRAAVSSSDHLDGAEAAGDGYFWQCLFLASITSPNRRQGALAFLVRKLPMLGDGHDGVSVPTANGKGQLELDGEDVKLSLPSADEAVISPEPGLLVRCFSAGLTDDQLLLQRGFLDLLVSHLPIDCKVLQSRVQAEDLQRLVTAAAGVVARRDMSLNRRLWTWLLGPDPARVTDNESPPGSPSSIADGLTSPGGSSRSKRTRYFKLYGLQPLVSSLRTMIAQQPLTPAERARPFRICLSLMDRWEIGGLVVPEIFMPALESVRRFESVSKSQEHFDEVKRSANVFFDGVESGLIWGELLGLIGPAIKSISRSATERLAKLDLAKFIVTHFNIREEEMLVVHIPLVALTILTLLDAPRPQETSSPERRDDDDDDDELRIDAMAFEISQTLIELIPERAFLVESSHQRSGTLSRQNHQWVLRNDEILSSIRKFYAQDQGNLEISNPPFSARDVGDLLLRQSSRIVSASLQPRASKADLASRTRLLVLLYHKIPRLEALQYQGIFTALETLLSGPLVDGRTPLPFPSLLAMTSLVSTLLDNVALDGGCGGGSHPRSTLISSLVRHLWSHLTPTYPKYHVEAVGCIWDLQSKLARTENTVEATLASLLTENDISGHFAVRAADGGRRFAVLWTQALQLQAKRSEGPIERGLEGDGQPGWQRSNGSVPQYEAVLGRPLFLLLDALDDEGTELCLHVRAWLSNMTSTDKLLHIVMRRILTFTDAGKLAGAVDDVSVTHSRPSLKENEDLSHLVYYMKTLLNLIRSSAGNVCRVLANASSHEDQATASASEERGLAAGESLQDVLAHLCLQSIRLPENSALQQDGDTGRNLQRTALSLLQQLLSSPYAASLAQLQLEYALIDRLSCSLNGADPTLQVPLIEATLSALRLSSEDEYGLPKAGSQRRGSKETMRSVRLSLSTDRSEKEAFLSAQITPSPPPPQLVKCLQDGFASQNSQMVLDHWVRFLSECLPRFSDTIFQVLIPLVETLCTQIGRSFEDLKSTFEQRESDGTFAPEASVISLLNGLEHVLASAHDRLVRDERRSAIAKGPEAPQGFFGNMVSGVFASETPQVRSANANNRLTVLLSFQDTLRICFAIWSWDGHGSDVGRQDPTSLASFSYTSLRTRNRARRMLEHLFAAEALECLECLVEIWRKCRLEKDAPRSATVFDLLQVLSGSRPQNTIPAIFNAIYSRSNPNALEPIRRSTVKLDIVETDLAAFLCEYARSLEDDAMDEIWGDCNTFLRDVLANPLPHRRTLPKLLEFTAVLGEKIDKTNFGEQRKLRRELGDLFVRLLSAALSTRPVTQSNDHSSSSTAAASVDKLQGEDQRSGSPHPRSASNGDEFITILTAIMPSLTKILIESDRVLGAATTISTGVIGPTIRSKSFPHNLSENVLNLLLQLVRVPNAQKSWRKDIADAFNDARFFAQDVGLVESRWLTLLRQWTLSDKDRMAELLSRITAPTTAGIVFGVGATSARLEADRRTQLNLRRVAVLILAGDEDAFVVNTGSIEERIEELLTATAASSPSSAVRAEVYMVLRSLVLKTSSIHLAPLWPVMAAELQAALSSILPDGDDGLLPASSPSIYGAASLLQACKLLDTLAVLAPDEFQLQQWLFVTDTIDAVYRPTAWQPAALADELADRLGSTAAAASARSQHQQVHQSPSGAEAPNKNPSRRPLLCSPDAPLAAAAAAAIAASAATSAELAKDELVATVLRPFFSQLSIHAFESTYAMGAPDCQACADGLLADLFDESTIVTA